VSLLLALTLLCAAPRAPALQAPGLAQEAGAEAALDRRRVLHLADGRVLRVRARQADGRWEVREGGGWMPLEGTLVRQSEERELLAEAGRRAREARDLDARLALVAWMAAEGLGPEALRELDPLLREVPDEPRVLALVRRGPLAACPLPGEVDRRADPAGFLGSVLVAGAQGTPAERELAVARLEAALSPVALRELVRLELRRPQPKRRELAILLARRAFSGELTPELSALAVADAFSEVRGEAAGALRAVGTAAAIEPTVSALEAPWGGVRANAVEALAAIGHPAAVGPLVAHLGRLAAGSGAPSGVRGHFTLSGQIALVTDYDVEIAQAASIGDPMVSVQGFGVVLDARAQAQITREVELRTTVLALERLTGLRDRSPEAWQEWWRAQGERWTAEAGEKRQ
jgi:hypothetical protein